MSTPPVPTPVPTKPARYRPRAVLERLRLNPWETDEVRVEEQDGEVSKYRHRFGSRARSSSIPQVAWIIRNLPLAFRQSGIEGYGPVGIEEGEGGEGGRLEGESLLYLIRSHRIPSAQRAEDVEAPPWPLIGDRLGGWEITGYGHGGGGRVLEAFVVKVVSRIGGP